MIVISLLAGLSLLWLMWQLYKAKRYNKFKRQLIIEFKPLVIEKIKEDLELNRSDIFPNNECHLNATLYYWTQSPAKILKASLKYELIDEQWLKNTSNWRNSQHLVYVEH